MTGRRKKVDLKCVLLGQASVGKSALFKRYLHDKWFEHHMPTVGAAFGAKTIEIGSKSVCIGIWDTAGSERYESMTRHYYTGATAACLCFSLIDARSWAKVKYWVSQVLAVEEDCLLTIVGMKSYLLDQQNRAVPVSVCQRYAASIDAKYFETSSVIGGECVSAPFTDIAEEWLKINAVNDSSSMDTVRVGSVVDLNTKSGGKCCGNN